MNLDYWIGWLCGIGTVLLLDRYTRCEANRRIRREKEQRR